MPWVLSVLFYSYKDNAHRLLRLCKTRLARHIGFMEMGMIVTSTLSDWSLYVLSIRMPQLQRLTCEVENSFSSLTFPARLRRLDLTFPETISAERVRALNAAIAVVASLPLLKHFGMAVQDDSGGCCFDPVAHCAVSAHPDAEFAPRSACAPRQRRRILSQLGSTSFTHVPRGAGQILAHAGDAPYDGVVCASRRVCEAVAQLSTLRELGIYPCCEHTDFLHQLPNLRRLELCFSRCTVQPDADRIIRSFHSLSCLTKLSLRNDKRAEQAHPLRFTSTHLSVCLPHMPLLTNLLLSGTTSLNSLHFLSTGPITRSLFKLELSDVESRLPLRELAHVHALSMLADSRLFNVFEQPLDGEIEVRYTPPSLLMPSLQLFRHWDF
jgi:hypothetical protein